MNYTTQEKAKLAMQSLLDACQLLAEYSKGSCKTAQYEAYFVPETMWYNRVHLQSGMGGELEACINALAAAVPAGEMPPIVSYMSGDYQRKDIVPLLRQAGYANPIPAQTAMFKSLEGYEPVESAITVERVPAELVGTWAQVVAEAFGKPTEKDGMLLLAADEECYFLMHREEGEIVAGMLLYCKDGNAGIHEVGTLPAYRGRGIAKALLHRAFAIAVEKGCTYATLQASPMGQPLYESLGFEAVGTINTWLQLPPGVTL